MKRENSEISNSPTSVAESDNKSAKKNRVAEQPENLTDSLSDHQETTEHSEKNAAVVQVTSHDLEKAFVVAHSKQWKHLHDGIAQIRTRLAHNVKYGLSLWAKAFLTWEELYNLEIDCKKVLEQIQKHVENNKPSEKPPEADSRPSSRNESTPKETDAGSASAVTITPRDGSRYCFSNASKSNAQDVVHLMEGLRRIERLHLSMDSPFRYVPGRLLTIHNLDMYQEINKVIGAAVQPAGVIFGEKLFELLLLVIRSHRVAVSSSQLSEDGASDLPVPPREMKLGPHKPLSTMGGIQMQQMWNPQTQQSMSHGMPGSSPYRSYDMSQQQRLNLTSLPSSNMSIQQPVLKSPFSRVNVDEASWHQSLPSVWHDSRSREVPDWIIMTIVTMARKYESQNVSELDQGWYSSYGSVVDFRVWGFSGLHDLISAIPGLYLRRDGSTYIVGCNHHLVAEAITQRWRDTPPPQGGGPIPVSVLQATQRQTFQQMVSGNPYSSDRMPGWLCSALLDLVVRHNGKNIGALQSAWRKESGGECIDFLSLGFSKFSDLLAEVPGVSLVKNGSAVTAHATTPLTSNNGPR